MNMVGNFKFYPSSSVELYMCVCMLGIYRCYVLYIQPMFVLEISIICMVCDCCG